VDRVEVSTVVYLSPEGIYEFLVDFPRYARYSKYLTEVTQNGDGGPGTRYTLRFAWWKLSYTAHTRVTDVDPPRALDWEVTEDLDARGHWRVEPDGVEAPSGREHACRVRLFIEFDASSAAPRALDLPRLVSLDWVIEKVKPLVQREAERVVERIVADVEGEPREVDLEIHATPDTV
jgi:ribosome-associated toxin RatA of RatAB toxin-antitoxin module